MENIIADIWILHQWNAPRVYLVQVLE